MKYSCMKTLALGSFLPCLLLTAICYTSEIHLPIHVTVQILQKFHVQDVIVIFNSADSADRTFAFELGKILSRGLLLVTFLGLPRQELCQLNERITGNTAHLVLMDDNTTLGFIHRELNRSDSSPVSVWFLVTPENVDASIQLRDLYVPHSSIVYLVVPSVDKVIVRNIYRMEIDGPLVITHAASWDNGEVRVMCNKMRVLPRRYDLRRVHVVVTTIQNPPMTYLEYKNGFYTLSGYTADLWHLLQDLLHFTYEVVPPCDNKFGKFDPEKKTWNGMIGQLTRGEADVAVTPMSQNPQRAEVVHFSTHVFHASYAMFLKEKESDFSWGSFMSPFSFSLWVSLALVIVILPVVQARMCRVAEGHGLEHSSDPAVFSVGQWLLYTLGACCQQGMYTTPTSDASRMVLWVTLASSLVMYNAYSASLISHLTIQTGILPFRSLGELLQSSYSVGVLEDSIMLDLMEIIHQKSQTSSSSNRKLRSVSVPNRLNGFEKACGENFAFVTLLESYPAFREKLPCSLTGVKIQKSSYFYFAVKKNYPHRKMMAYYLRRLNEAGIRQKFQRQWWPSESTDHPQQETSLDMEMVSFSFVCLASGMMLSLILLMAENFYEKIKKTWARDKIVNMQK